MFRLFTVLLIACSFTTCIERAQQPLDMNKYFAWCIVPFDNQNRTPEQRIELLKMLGFKSYAYDWRQEHLKTAAHEFALAKQNNIKINAVWMWIDRHDSVGHLSANNEHILNIVSEANLKTQIWIGMSEAFFENLDDAGCLDKAVQFISYLDERTSAMKCGIGLYNHGGWFGDPRNQLKIIKALPNKKVGIIFNFHHAHELLDDFPVLLDEMYPYLWAVNLNGMKKDGPKILPIGGGDLEDDMIRLLEQKGYKGPYGVLGHVEDADVEEILERNLEGLMYMNSNPI